MNSKSCIGQILLYGFLILITILIIMSPGIVVLSVINYLIHFTRVITLSVKTYHVISLIISLIMFLFFVVIISTVAGTDWKKARLFYLVVCIPMFILQLVFPDVCGNIIRPTPTPTPTPQYTYKEPEPYKRIKHTPTPENTGKDKKEFNEKAIKNMQLNVVEMETVKLKNGNYKRTGRDYLDVNITDIAFGDLNNDNIEDAAVIYLCSYGGSGAFYYLTAVFDNNGDIAQIGNEALGDRAEIKNMSISSGKIYITLIKWKETVTEDFVYRLKGDKLSLTTSEAIPVPVKTSGEEYIVQAGIFGDRDNAEKLITKLNNKGYEGTIVVIDNGRDYSYRVQAGAFTTKDEADKLKGKLKSDGIDAIVKKLETSGQETTMTSPGGQTSIKKISSYDITITCSDQRTETEASRDYGADLTLDGKRDTAWNTEGSYGKWIKYSFDRNINCVKIGILPGYDKCEADEYGDRWYNNNRIKEATLIFSDGTTKSITFTGNREIEYFEFVTPINTSFVKIEIDEVSRGNKFDDTCISEVEIYSSI